MGDGLLRIATGKGRYCCVVQSLEAFRSDPTLLGTGYYDTVVVVGTVGGNICTLCTVVVKGLEHTGWCVLSG